jgi:predicted metal-dependent hydrolase
MNKTTISKQLYHYGEQQLEYTLIKSKRRKTSEIIVDENEIILRIPSNKSLNDAEKLMGDKIKWIIRKQKEYKERIPQIVKSSFLQGSTIPYLGKNYEIEIINDRNNEHDKIELEKDKFVVTLSSKRNSRNDDDNRIKSLYEDWLYHQAVEIFEEKIKYLSSIIDVSPKRIIIKKLKNRWGSATKEGTISLNFNLIKAPDNIIDYVIIHELCHFMIKEHSHHFWSLLKKYVADYNTKIEWLEINSKHLIS